MPSRKLPNSDTQLLNAMNAAWSKYQKTTGAARLLSEEQGRKLEDPPTPLPAGYALSLRAQFHKELAEVGPALSKQADLTEDFEHSASALAQITSHFIQVFNLAVQRGGIFSRSDRAYYGLDVSGSTVPPLVGYLEVEQWAQKIVDGEAKRLLEQPTAKPMAMPAASEVAAELATFRALHDQQSNAKDAYTTELTQVDALRPTVARFVADLWDTIEFQLRAHDGPTLRRYAREWGVIYLTRPGETPDPEPTPAPSSPSTSASDSHPA